MCNDMNKQKVIVCQWGIPPGHDQRFHQTHTKHITYDGIAAKCANHRTIGFGEIHRHLRGNGDVWHLILVAVGVRGVCVDVGVGVCGCAGVCACLCSVQA